MSANGKKLLVIGHVWPEPKATAAGQRMFHLLHFFKESGFQVTFGSAASKTEYSENLSEIGVHEVSIKLNDSEFDDFALELSPDIVLFDRFMTEEQYGWRIAETLPDCIRILNTEDLHSLRSVRKASVGNNIDFEVSQWLKADITKRELASIYRSDLSLIISSYEMDLLRNSIQIWDDLLFYFPLFYMPNESETAPINPGFADRSDFIFIGNGKHLPNQDAIIWLKDKIWPEIHRELPAAKLHIYGAYLPPHILNLHCAEEGFMVHGHVDSSREVLRKSRVNLAPLRFGAGLKGKILDAMHNGTPSVSTHIAYEGIEPADTISGQIGSDSKSFASEAIELHKNQERWEARQAAENQLLVDRFNRLKFEKNFRKKLDDIQHDLEAHRLRNPIGSMLMHHTLSSTKYMSKWIEAKNS